MAKDWIRADMPADQSLAKLRSGRAENVFIDIRAYEGPGTPYHFRHGLPAHKTNAHAWRSMRHRNDRHLRRQGRDIHLVPIEFIYLGPDTFRHPGSKFLLLNTNVAETRQALKTARETENSYVLLSADICIAILKQFMTWTTHVGSTSGNQGQFPKSKTKMD